MEGLGIPTLETARVISLILPENRRSIRVAERIGESYERKIVKFERDFPI